MFFRVGTSLLRLEDVREIDTRNLEDVRVSVRMHDERVFDLSGPDAIELVMMAKPSAFEGRRLQWVRHRWVLHNLVGHPVMQLLALLRLPATGIWVHERTTPRPIGPKKRT